MTRILDTVIFVIKFLLSSIWIMVATLILVPICFARWGNLNLDRDAGRLMSWGIRKICGIKIEVEGKEFGQSATPAIYVANHQSAMDVVMFGMVCPDRTVIIGKRELIYTPFFGILFWAAGNVMIDRKNHGKAVAGLDQVLEAVRERKANVFIFPEGTRNGTGEGLLPFKKGAFHMAIAAQIPIIPVVCSPLGPLMGRSNGLRLHSGTVRMRFLPPIQTTGMRIDQVTELRDRSRDVMLQTLQSLQSTRS